MKKVFLLLAVLGMCLFGKTQRVYFIYLQTENGTPFFIKMGDKVYSSTATGYVILSKLVDSTYTFSVGMLNSQAGEAAFSVSLDKNDKGFLLRNVNDHISLYNLQTSQVLNPVSTTNTQTQSAAAKADNFTRLLSQAADDPSLLTASVVTKQQTAAIPEKREPVRETIPTVVPKKDTTTKSEILASAPAIQKKEHNDSLRTTTAVIIKDTVAIASKEVRPNTVVQPIVYNKSVITKRSESSTTEGFGLVFLDKLTDAVDTIRLFIPNQKTVFQLAPVKTTDTTRLLQKNDTQHVQATTEVRAIAKTTTCSNIATENDFLKLRKNMAARETEEGMVDEAKRHFVKKCFTVDQVKYLSALFLTPAGKYRFFDAAYPHVTDQTAFRTLQAEIRDDYYANRFKALISNQ